MQAITALLGLVFAGIAGRALGAQQLSFLALAAAALMLGRSWLDLGTSHMLREALALEPERERELVETALGWRLWACLPAGAALAAALLLEPDPGRRLALIALGAALLREPAGAFSGSMVLRGAAAEEALIALASRALLVLLALLLYWSAAPPAAWIGALGLTALAESASRRRLWRLVCGSAARARPRSPGLGAMLRASRGEGLARLCLLSLPLTDLLTVRLAHGAQSLGQFALSWLPLAAALAAAPHLSRSLSPACQSTRADSARFNLLLRGAGFLALSLGGLLAAGLAVLSPEVLEALYGQGMDATWTPAVMGWYGLALGLLISSSAARAGLEALGVSTLAPALGALLLDLVLDLSLLSSGPQTAAATSACSLAAAGLFTTLALLRRRGAASLPRKPHVALLPGGLLAALLVLLPATGAARLFLGALLAALLLLSLCMGRPARELLRALAGQAPAPPPNRL